MSFLIGLIVSLGCMLGGFAALGGHLSTIWQPFELIIIGGSAIGIFIMGNPFSVIADTGRASIEAILEKGPKQKDFLDILGLLHALMRELRGKARNEVEAHVDAPQESDIFKNFPTVLADKELTQFICDYCRLIIIGNARTHEIEALMDEEIETITHDKMKAYHGMVSIGDGLPALGIVAAVLGVIHAMGALNESPEVLGHLIGAALVGTFAGIFMAYGLAAPLAAKIKTARQKKLRIYVIVKQSLLAFMNGAMPQIAVEHGRKTIPAKQRPTIDQVENETISGGANRAEAA